jgi:hypothetical protein
MSEHNKHKKSQLDIHQIFKHAFDPENQALRTTPGVDSHFAISLNAAEDSVTAEAKHLLISDQNPVSCVGIKTICLYSSSVPAKAQVSPADSGDEWHDVCVASANSMSAVIQICARRLRIVGENASVVGQG